MTNKTKVCAQCSKRLSINKFYKSNRLNDGYDYYCKECRKSNTLVSHRGGKRKKACTITGCDKPNYATNICKMHYERRRRTGTTNLINTGKMIYSNGQTYAKIRENHLMRTYKISLNQFEIMSANGCEICGKHGAEYKKLHVDHDHACCPVAKYNKKGNVNTYFKTCGLCVRGILCDGCNAAVGLYEKGRLRDEYPHRDGIILYVSKYSWVIADRKKADDNKRKRQG